MAGRVPVGPELEAHLATCPECRELLEDDGRLGRGLGGAVLPEPDPGGLFALVDRDIARDSGPRSKLRALPTRVRAVLVASAAGALLVSQLWLRPRPDLGVYSPVVFWSAALLLAVTIVVGALRLLRGPTAPLDSSRAERSLSVLLLAVPALVSLLAPLGSDEAATRWGSPAYCLGYGVALTAPLVLLYWLLERRDAPPSSALLSAGALAGVAANLLLHAHCASAHPGHLLLGHVSVGVAWATLLWLMKRPAQVAR